MEDETTKSVDMFGAKSWGDALKKAVEKSFDGAEAFLKRVCLPAAEELGLLFRDRVQFWRLMNMIKMVQKAEGFLQIADGQLQLVAHPRVAAKIIDEASWQDDDEVQSMWAGLLASSCTEDGEDDSNLLFINLLSQLSAAQAKTINYLCKTTKKSADKYGTVSGQYVYITLGELMEISGIQDMQRLDREIDHLKTVGLLTAVMQEGGLEIPDDYRQYTIGLFPSELAISLYVRSQGFVGSPKEYFGVKREYIKNGHKVIAD
jgi:hypothetical protein